MRVTVCELPHETAALAVAWVGLCEHVAAHRSQLVLLPEFAMVQPVWEAERFDADVAAKIGLVHHVVENETAMDKLVEHYASLVYEASPAAITDTKSLVAEVTGELIDASLGHKTAKRLAHRRVSPQGKEGLSAFLEKRKPNWAR